MNSKDNFLKNKLLVAIFLAFLLFLSLIPRLWNLTTYPPVIVDESANIRDIQKLQASNEFRPIDFEWGYGQATLVHYPPFFLVELGLENLLAVRLTSVILSILTLIPFFFVVKNYTNSTIAFCGTILFSFSYYYLQFSRVGWTNIHPIFLGLYLIWLVQEAIEKKSGLLFAVCGIIAGLLMYSYRSGQIYICSFFIINCLFFQRKKYKA